MKINNITNMVPLFIDLEVNGKETGIFCYVKDDEVYLPNKEEVNEVELFQAITEYFVKLQAPLILSATESAKTVMDEYDRGKKSNDLWQN